MLSWNGFDTNSLSYFRHCRIPIFQGIQRSLLASTEAYPFSKPFCRIVSAFPIWLPPQLGFRSIYGSLDFRPMRLIVSSSDRAGTCMRPADQPAISFSYPFSPPPLSPCSLSLDSDVSITSFFHSINRSLVSQTKPFPFRSRSPSKALLPRAKQFSQEPIVGTANEHSNLWFRRTTTRSSALETTQLFYPVWPEIDQV